MGGRRFVNYQDHGALTALRGAHQAELGFGKDGSVQHENARVDVANEASRRRNAAKLLRQRHAPPASFVGAWNSPSKLTAGPSNKLDGLTHRPQLEHPRLSAMADSSTAEPVNHQNWLPHASLPCLGLTPDTEPPRTDHGTASIGPKSTGIY